MSCLASLLKLNILDLHDNQVPASHCAPTSNIVLINRKYAENADILYLQIADSLFTSYTL